MQNALTRRPIAFTRALRRIESRCVNVPTGFRAVLEEKGQALVLARLLLRFLLDDPLPGLLQQLLGSEQVIAAQAVRRLEPSVVLILVRSLQADAMERHFPVAYRVTIREDGDREAAGTNDFHGFGAGFGRLKRNGVFHKEKGKG